MIIHQVLEHTLTCIKKRKRTPPETTKHAEETQNETKADRPQVLGHCSHNCQRAVTSCTGLTGPAWPVRFSGQPDPGQDLGGTGKEDHRGAACPTTDAPRSWEGMEGRSVVLSLPPTTYCWEHNSGVELRVPDRVCRQRKTTFGRAVNSRTETINQVTKPKQLIS